MLRSAAVLIEQAGIAGLSLVIDDLITIQVPAHLADPASRAGAVAVLAAAGGGGTPSTPARPEAYSYGCGAPVIGEWAYLAETGGTTA
jgi:hypothetical protein